MEPIILFTGEDLVSLMDMLSNLVDSYNRFNLCELYELRFAINEGGLKIKANNLVWSPAMGKEGI